MLAPARARGAKGRSEFDGPRGSLAAELPAPPAPEVGDGLVKHDGVVDGRDLCRVVRHAIWLHWKPLSFVVVPGGVSPPPGVPSRFVYKTADFRRRTAARRVELGQAVFESIKASQSRMPNRRGERRTSLSG